MLEVYDNDILWCTYMYHIGLYRTVKCEQKYRWTNQPSCVSRWLGGWRGGSVLGDGTQSAQLVTPETHHINRIYPSQSYQSNQNFWCYYRCGYCLSFIVSEENIAGYINMANFKLFDIFGFNVSTLIVREVPMSSSIMTWMGDSFEAESWIYCN